MNTAQNDTQHDAPDLAPAPVSMIHFKPTDTGNAERLVALYRGRIRYCSDRKKWLVWDNARWAWALRGEVERAAKSTVRSMYADALQVPDDDRRKDLVKHAMASESAGRRKAMIELAQSEAGVPLLAADLDNDPWLFNVANGTLNLQTGVLREASPDDLITKRSPARYVEGAHSEVWDAFLNDVTGGDSDLAEYLKRLVGYCLTGHVTEKAFFFLYGVPDGMKSTFVAAIDAALGDYAASAAFTTWLVQTNTGGNRGDLVALQGARFVASIEVRAGARFDEELIKRVTGGDPVTAAAKYEGEITFLPQFKLVLAANDAPTIRDDDAGAWSRVRRVPFNNPLPQAKRDPMMRQKLQAPEVQSAILSWALEGCREWQLKGLGTCAAVERSTADYRTEMDRSAGFFDDCLEFKAGAKISAAELRHAYERWCQENGVRAPLSSKALAPRLQQRGAEAGLVGQARGWHGVQLSC